MFCMLSAQASCAMHEDTFVVRREDGVVICCADTIFCCAVLSTFPLSASCSGHTLCRCSFARQTLWFVWFMPVACLLLG